jgi:large subunit ribosomal protein L30e
MVDVGKAIRMAVDTGSVEFGERAGVKAALNGTARLIVLSRNCPKKIRDNVQYYSKISGVRMYEYDGTSLALGSLCGRPHLVAVLSVLEPGNSNILEIAKQVA